MIGLIEVKSLSTQTTQIEMRCIGGSIRRRIRHSAYIRSRSERGWRALG
jgi:hypothetical protein